MIHMFVGFSNFFQTALTGAKLSDKVAHDKSSRRDTTAEKTVHIAEKTYPSDRQGTFFLFELPARPGAYPKN